MGVYEQFLTDSVQHSFECGWIANPVEDVSTWEETVEKVEYVTEDQGRITVTVTVEGDVDVDCSRVGEYCSPIWTSSLQRHPSTSETLPQKPYNTKRHCRMIWLI